MARTACYLLLISPEIAVPAIAPHDSFAPSTATTTLLLPQLAQGLCVLVPLLPLLLPLPTAATATGTTKS